MNLAVVSAKFMSAVSGSEWNKEPSMKRAPIPCETFPYMRKNSASKPPGITSKGA